MVADLRPILEKSAESHHHLCPRQVLGARIGLAGADALGFAVPIKHKKLLTIVETDGCFISGVAAATGCYVHRRTMRIEDIGRVAATFIDVKRERAVRVAPQPDIRQKAWQHLGEKVRRRERYFAMLHAYQMIPVAQLLTIQEVRLSRSIKEIVSRPSVRTLCAICGEEVINEREIVVANRPICLQCSGRGYYLGSGDSHSPLTV